MIEALILVYYYVLVLTGMLLCSVNAYGRLWPHSALPVALRCLLGFGVCSIAVSYLGWLSLFRLPGSAQAAGLAFAGYALWHHRQIYELARASYKAQPYVAWFIAGIVAIAALAKWCYLSGGVNNIDEMRSVALTAAFSANYLKPAFQYNLSVPISYNYSFYQIPAFLYASTAGSSWPSLPLLLTSIASITFFYVIFALCLRAAFPQHTRYSILLGLLSITFFGLDIFINPDALKDRHIEWWNFYQFTQMASYHHWAYQYLCGLSFALAAIYSVSRYCQTLQREWLYALTAFTGLCIVFGTITGIWLCSILILFGIGMLCLIRGLIPAVIPRLPGMLLIMLVILLPQLFNFIGRTSLVGFSTPLMWFTRDNVKLLTRDKMSSSPELWWENISILWNELGPLLMIGFLALPFFGWYALRQRQWFLIAVFSMGVVAVLGASFTATPWIDWYWRGSNLFSTVSSVIGAVWLYEILRHKIRTLWLHMAVLTLLIPGMLNYMAESLFRSQSCVSAPALSRQIHEEVPLHAIVVPGANAPKHHILLGGRAFFSNHEDIFNRGYRNTEEFLVKRLRAAPVKNVCDTTWFGKAAPSGTIVYAPQKGILVPLSCNDPNTQKLLDAKDH